MAPVSPIEVEQEQPVSRTYQYRKVMKPMLERKRRARINKCLDELKDLMVSALASEGENVTKLEKADVLELTVRHLRKLKQNHLLGILNPGVLHERYMAGFTHCAAQVSTFLTSGSQADVAVTARLMGHITKYMQTMDKMAAVHGAARFPAPLVAAPQAQRIVTPPLTPPGSGQVTAPLPLHRPMRVLCQLSPPASCASDLSPSGSEVSSPRPAEVTPDDEKVWRPW